MKEIIKPSDIFILLASLFSMGISIYYWFSGMKDTGMFIGIWVPSILAFGIYIKLLIYNKK
ncbi:MAG: hypothetical protein RI513_05055 [Balneolaceae bacterium]|nr:hypothetical protein [Balneolaceae bacterium]MDR9447474.1 hypothetical protein [Balneolaceae bacterium]